MSHARAQNAFHFVTRANVIELTGLAASSLAELVQILKTAPSTVTYYHTHNFLKQHHFLSPEPPNDFAYWVQTSLNEDRLAEQLAAIDTVRFQSLRALRDKLVDVMEKRLAKRPAPRPAVEGEEFYFRKSISVIMPTPYQAYDLKEFTEALQQVTIHSLYHHIFESRLRLERSTNDFSSWLEKELHETTLARAIERLDPYTQTLESLREKILRLSRARLPETAPEGAYAS